MFMKTQTFWVYDPSSVLDGRAHVEKLRAYCLNVAEVYV